jgi:carboxymethylenebutenolidase
MGALEAGPQRATVERITLNGRDGTAVDAILATPDDATGGVVLHPDVMGVRPLFDDLCQRLATHGYVVCCPEPFARAPSDIRDADDAAVRLDFLPHLDDSVQLDDLAVAADRVGFPDVAVLGFCMGGMQTLKAAATGRFQRAVPVYGMIRLPVPWRGGGLSEPLDHVADVCPTLAILGGADPFTPPEDIEALRTAWQHRDDCTVVVYPDADHGFVHAPDRPAHRADDAADVWRRTLAFLAG